MPVKSKAIVHKTASGKFKKPPSLKVEAAKDKKKGC